MLVYYTLWYNGYSINYCDSKDKLECNSFIYRAIYPTMDLFGHKNRTSTGVTTDSVTTTNYVSRYDLREIDS